MDDVVFNWTHIVAAALAAAFGAVVVAVATHWATKRRERRNEKRAVLQRLCRDRAHILGLLTGDATERYDALNEVPIAYADAPAVLAAFRHLHEQRQWPERLRDNLVTLIKAMAENAGVDLSPLNDSFILEPFTPESLPWRCERPPGEVLAHSGNGRRPETTGSADEQRSRAGGSRWRD